MSAIVPQLIGISIVCSTACAGAHQRKHQSLASLAFAMGIQRSPVVSPHRGPVTRQHQTTRWRHKMETFSTLLALCAGNPPIPGEFPAQRPVTRSSDVFFDLRLNKRLSKQPWGWWFETLPRSLWRDCNESTLNMFLMLTLNLFLMVRSIKLYLHFLKSVIDGLGSWIPRGRHDYSIFIFYIAYSYPSLS